MRRYRVSKEVVSLRVSVSKLTNLLPSPFGLANLGSDLPKYTKRETGLAAAEAALRATHKLHSRTRAVQSLRVGARSSLEAYGIFGFPVMIAVSRRPT